jgi:hypothetical protein
MLMHIALFKLKDRRPEEVAKAREKLMELGRMPQLRLRSLDVSADIMHAESSYDIALLATFSQTHKIWDWKRPG